jgi:hypothetical protein
MNKNLRNLKIAALAATALGASAISGAQSFDPTIPVTLSYGPAIGTKASPGLAYAQTSRNTWNTVLLVSAIVLVVGLIQEESTLVILGGAGVIVSLIQMDKRFQLQYSPKGITLFNSGPLTFGLNPLSQPGLVDKPGPARLGYFAGLNFKF